MIGLFDSGIGGLSVLKAIRARMPNADIVYFGDIEHAPYGEKSMREIRTLIAMALQRLAAQGATDIISACNSASVSVHLLPIDLLRMRKFEVIEMVAPTVAALAAEGKRIALLGTTATIRSAIYQKAFTQKEIDITAIPVPHLASLIETGASAEEMIPLISGAVDKAIAGGAEIISLSCTHYPFVCDLFEADLESKGSSIQLFDPAEAVAKEVQSRFSSDGSGVLRFLISKESATFSSYVEKLFAEESYTIEPAGSIYWALKAI